jgi:hypothetical protein
MTTFYTAAAKERLQADIVFIDEQLDYARDRMARGDKAEAWSTFDSLLGYFDFKKHFPDILIGDDEYMRFMDMYEALRNIDDIIEIDATGLLAGGAPNDWRPGHSRDDILRLMREFLDQIDRWKALDWFEGDDILDAFDKLKGKIEDYIRFFENYDDQPFWGPVIDVRRAKKPLWRALSDDLPFWEIYEALLSMDRNLTYLVFKFRLHIDEVTLEMVESVVRELKERKHAISAIIRAARAPDEGIQQPPPGWDDLQPYPPPGYAMVGPEFVPIASRRRRHPERGKKRA